MELRNKLVKDYPPKVGDYVFASRYSDCDWNDPWKVGVVTRVSDLGHYISIGDFGIWKYAMPITKEQGDNVILRYPHLEGLEFDPEYAACAIFMMKEDNTKDK